MGLGPLYIFYSFSARVDFRRQNLASTYVIFVIWVGIEFTYDLCIDLFVANF